MSAKTYAEKLRDPRWQKKRLEILKSSEFSCSCCGDSESELHVHHRVYFRNRDPWDYENKFLIPVCEECHKAIADTERDVMALLCEFPFYLVSDLRGALQDILNDPCPSKVWSAWIKSVRPKKRKAKK